MGLTAVQSVYLRRKKKVKQTLMVDITDYRGADKSLARPGRKQATGTENFELHISYL
jgi:hypothetical protein